MDDVDAAVCVNVCVYSVSMVWTLHAGDPADGPRAVLMMNIWHPSLVGDEAAQAYSLERFAAQQSTYSAGASLGAVG